MKSRPPDPAFDAALAQAVADYSLSDIETPDDRVEGSSVRKRSFRQATSHKMDALRLRAGRHGY